MDETARGESPVSLEDLMASTARGDRRAFAALYRLTGGRILAVVLRMVGDRAMAEEVLQETYLTIWRKAGQYRPERGAPLAWIAAIARNKAIDRLRAGGPAMRDLDDLDDRTVAQISQSAADAALPRHLADTIRRCVEALETNYRKAVLLAYYCGLSHQELAAALGSPLGTVKSWVRRGLLQLKECVDQ